MRIGRPCFLSLACSSCKAKQPPSQKGVGENGMKFEAVHVVLFVSKIYAVEQEGRIGVFRRNIFEIDV